MLVFCVFDRLVVMRLMMFGLFLLDSVCSVLMMFLLVFMMVDIWFIVVVCNGIGLWKWCMKKILLNVV